MTRKQIPSCEELEGQALNGGRADVSVTSGFRLTAEAAIVACHHWWLQGCSVLSHRAEAFL